jgi:PTS system nitrogen regulatory IIA component
MQLNDVLSPMHVFSNDSIINSKKQVLERISHTACQAHPNLNYVEVLQALIQRERLGSTALGHGVAIPHARIQNIGKPLVCLLTLHNAVNFYEDDHVAIDIVFGILAPENANKEQLGILADIATRLKNQYYRDQLRAAKDNKTLYQAAIGKLT